MAKSEGATHKTPAKETQFTGQDKKKEKSHKKTLTSPFLMKLLPRVSVSRLPDRMPEVENVVVIPLKVWEIPWVEIVMIG